MERIIQFRGGPQAVGAARGMVVENARELPEGTLDDLRLLVSELVTNAIRHGGADEGSVFSLRLLLDPLRIRVEVTDAGPGFDRRTPAPRSDGGWGLVFVDRLADRWGVDHNGTTKVWFEIDLPEQGRRRGFERLSA